MKEYAKEFYSSTRWKHTREAYAKSVGGLCERCLKKGQYKAGEVVHHIKHITPNNIDNPDITLNWNNLQLLCTQCHAEVHSNSTQLRRYKVDEMGRVTGIV